jgi:phosphatidylethanolamine/phosphatidyl-N-methylethanolamine N-methyltransferase
MTTASLDLPVAPPRRTALFIREFLRDPLTTASLVPSSRALAAAMVADRALGVVVELGPGTGAFTVALQERTPARHIGIELNTLLAKRLAADFPMVEVETAPVERLERILDSKDLVGRVDQVVSGLPWQAFSGPVGGELIPAITRVLRPGGTFTQFTYSWTRWAVPGRRQHEALRSNFAEVHVSRPIWRNFPPATVYTCRRPLQRR